MRDIQPVLLSGVSKGAPFGTRLCLQSVVCYTLCRRCCENAVAAGEGKGIFTAGKQGCDCVVWSRKRRTGFISRQGVYECPRPSSYAELWDKVSQTDSHTYEKADGFFSQNWNGREAILGLSRLDCPSAKTGGTVNGGTWNAPFILTVDWLGWLCYLYLITL